MSPWCNSSKEVKRKGEADKEIEAVQRDQTVTDKTKECRRGMLWTGWRWWVSLRQVERQKTAQQKSYPYCMKWRHEHSSSTTFPCRGSSLYPRGYVELSTTPISFVPLTLLSLSLSLSRSLSIHPFREHQQCFCPGLHQRVPDSEWPAGQRKPTLLSRIHSHRQGELLNRRRLGDGGTVAAEKRDRKSVLPVDQEKALIW